MNQLRRPIILTLLFFIFVSAYTFQHYIHNKPKVATGGPVTLECALGLKTPDGYYALDRSSILSTNYPMLTGNESITMESTLVPIEMISSDRWSTYDVRGIIAVEKVTKQ